VRSEFGPVSQCILNGLMMSRFIIGHDYFPYRDRYARRTL